MRDHPQDYILEGRNLSELRFSDVLQHSTQAIESYKKGLVEIQPLQIEVDGGVFTNVSPLAQFPNVTVSQAGNSLLLHCPCKAVKKTLCKHQAEVLCNILDRPYLRIFFDAKARHQRFLELAKDYGMEHEPDLDAYFALEYTHNAVKVAPKISDLIPFDEAGREEIADQLLPRKVIPKAVLRDAGDSEKMILVFRPHKYYSDQFHIELIETQVAQNGKPKGPFQSVDPQYLIWNTESLEAAKFYIAISKFQGTAGMRNAETMLEILGAIARNPLKLETYYHKAPGNVNLGANTLAPVLLQCPPLEVKLTVDQKEPFFEVTGELCLYDKSVPLDKVELKFDYFLLLGNTMNLVGDANTFRVMEFFKKHHHKVFIHPTKFEQFRQEILTKLELKIAVKYAYVKPATQKQLEAKGFDHTVEKLIYLSEERNYVYLTPVVKYGNVEIVVFSRQQIFDTDPNGHTFKVERDNDLEVKFTALVMQQHPDFEAQLNENEYFYLHKRKFLDETWFLDALEALRQEGVSILGFNELSKMKLSLHKGRVNVQVSSDMDWFNAKVKVQFGQQTASLKQLQKSVKNRSKYVQLDDGTVGILPLEWMTKFAGYFQSGDLVEDSILIPKSRFMEIEELFGEEVLDKEARNDLRRYMQRFADFAGIPEVEVPAALQGTLRGYQKHGLNWLCFLDEFHFGACLADDMGLGKTIQILALLLKQREQRGPNTNLVIVPTSLLFNWQTEASRFAPSLSLFTHYGGQRLKAVADIGQYDIVLTTYGMLQSDGELLRRFDFNYIILDESQAIKNPDSQRYKLARLLRSRNKIVLTGTPFENNTYDIYGQLSFACPGLLGSKTYFKNIYSNPIDKLEDGGKSSRLQRIIHPFVLRRTKRQVATELPEKTEMVLYCEMGPQQRQLYEEEQQKVRELLLHKNSKKNPTDYMVKPPMYFLKGLTKLRQICDAPQIVLEQGFESEGSSKIDVLIEQISSKSPQHKILVFSQFVSMLDLIKKELERQGIPFAYLTGQTRDRAAQVNEFQANADIRVFLMSLKAGGVGLNLTEADYVYIVDPWWNPAVENQAIDRCYRIGQSKHVVAVRLICPGTIEEKIMLLQAKKHRLGSELIQTDAEVLKSLSREELLAMLR